MIKKYKYLLIFILLFTSKSHAIDFKGKFIQGHFIIGKTEPGTSILVDKKKVKVSKDGYPQITEFKILQEYIKTAANQMAKKNGKNKNEDASS